MRVALAMALFLSCGCDVLYGGWQHLDVAVTTLPGKFADPTGIALDHAGGLIVSQYDAAVVSRIAADGQSVTPLISDAIVKMKLPPGTSFAAPFAVMMAGDDILVQTDDSRTGTKNDTSGTIWKLQQDGTIDVVIEGLGRPRGLALLPNGRIFVSDERRHTVGTLDLAPGKLDPLAGQDLMPGYRDGNGGEALFNEPYGSAVLPDGSVLVADHGNHCIRQVTLGGRVTTYAGGLTPGTADGPRLRAQFDGPRAIATDEAGNAYVVDVGAKNVRMIIYPSGEVVTLAGDGTAGYRDGPGRQAWFFGLEGVAVTGDGQTVYASDGSLGQDGSDGEAKLDDVYYRIRKLGPPAQ